MNLWCQRQIVVHIEGPEGHREIVVPRPFARIGAHPGSEIVLTGPDVAKRALYLHATDDGINCLNLDLPDAKIDERGRWITSDDVLTVGAYRLKVQTDRGPIGAPELPELVAHGSAGVPIPLMYIRCNRLLKDRRRFRSRLMIVGRRPNCSLQLRGGKVSSFHCVFYWQDHRLWCLDLLSSNGTTLQGQPIDCREVQMGEQLEIGEFEIIYHRWSPRAAMDPGWQPNAADIAHEENQPHAEQSAITADDHASLVASDAGQVSQLQQQLEQRQIERDELAQKLAQQMGEHEAVAARLAEEQIKVEAERESWDQDRETLITQLHEQAVREREELVQELALRSSEQQSTAARLLEEQGNLEAAREAWDRERLELTRQLEEHAEQLARLEAQLSSAAAVQASDRELAMETFTVVPSEFSQPTDGLSTVDESESATREVFAAHDNLLAPSASEAASVAVLQPRVSATPIGRATRRKSERRDLTDFVSGRLEDIEGSKRRRALLVWGAVGLAVALSTAAFGVWTWLN